MAEPTPQAAGITLQGDYLDLISLHETIHELVKNGPDAEEENNAILGLAYDVRKAYEKQREEVRIGPDEWETTYQCVNILWPVVILQTNALRHLAAYQPTSREQQANLYRLESCLEKSLMETEPVIGKKCTDLLFGPGWLTSGYYTLFLNELADEYISGPETGIERFRKLPEILEKANPFSKAYRNFASGLEEQAKQLGCHPGELSDFSEGVDFQW